MSATEITVAEKNQIFHTLLGKKGEITKVLPDKMDPEEIMKSLKSLFGGLDGADRNISKCKPLIGRLMILVKGTPSTYEDLGYESYEDFKKSELSKITGYSRSTLGECKQLIEKWPNLRMEDYALYRWNKLLLIGKWTNQQESGHRKYLDWCEKYSLEEIRERAIAAGLIEEGEAEGASLRVTGSKAMVKRVKSFLVDERAIAYFGTKDPLAMIEKAFQESSTQFPAEATEAA